MANALVIAAPLVTHTTSDGRSNWFTGVLLWVLYLLNSCRVLSRISLTLDHWVAIAC